jgi:hypothetical protein
MPQQSVTVGEQLSTIDESCCLILKSDARNPKFEFKITQSVN